MCVCACVCVCLSQVDQLDQPESTYQTTFDTVEGQWHDVMLPWGSFVPVKRAQSDPEGECAAQRHTRAGARAQTRT